MGFKESKLNATVSQMAKFLCVGFLTSVSKHCFQKQVVSTVFFIILDRRKRIIYPYCIGT